MTQQANRTMPWEIADTCKHAGTRLTSFGIRECVTCGEAIAATRDRGGFYICEWCSPQQRTRYGRMTEHELADHLIRRHNSKPPIKRMDYVRADGEVTGHW